MDVYVAGMPVPKPKNQKEWTREEFRALVELAGRKGIQKKELAEHWLGVHPGSLSRWLSDDASYRLSDTLRKLLSAIELQITKLPDDE